MSLVAFSQFYEYIEPRVPGGIPDPALQRAIRDGAIRIYRETGFIQEYLPANVALAVNQSVYEIVSPEPEQSICDIVRMQTVGGIPVYKHERVWLDQHRDNWEAATGPIPDVYFILDWTDARCRFQVNPIPNVASDATNLTSLMIRVALCPTTISRYLDGSGYNVMRDAVKAAALKDLFEQKGMTFYDPQLAAFYDAEMLRLIGDLRIRREQGEGKNVMICQTGKLGDWYMAP